MRLIVGLGNPGEEYAQTPHNAGFMVLDALARKYDREWAPKFAALICTLHLPAAREGALLMKPQLYMNRSGKAVIEAVRFYKITRHDIWLVHDELDLPLGGLKVVGNRSAAGHKGVASVIDTLGTQSFYRWRVGVMPPKKPANPDAYLTNEPLSPENAKLIKPALARAQETIVLGLTHGITAAINEANRPPAQKSE